MTAKKERGKEVKIKSKPAPKSSSPVEKALIDNFISLQRVMANMASKLDTLNDRVSKLLDVFEISAKALAEKDFNFQSDQETVEKLDKLIDQNKVIAKGLTMLYENFDANNYKKEQSLKEAVNPLRIPTPSSPQRPGFFSQIIPRRIPSREEQEKMGAMHPNPQSQNSRFPQRQMPQNTFKQPQTQQQIDFEGEPSQAQMEERGTSTQGYRASIMEKGEEDSQDGQEQNQDQNNQKNRNGKDELEDIFSGY